MASGVEEAGADTAERESSKELLLDEEALGTEMITCTIEEADSIIYRALATEEVSGKGKKLAPVKPADPHRVRHENMPARPASDWSIVRIYLRVLRPRLVHRENIPARP
eukprot:6243811-Pyramimonas_sp.AAC.1